MPLVDLCYDLGLDAEPRHRSAAFALACTRFEWHIYGAEPARHQLNATTSLSVRSTDHTFIAIMTSQNGTDLGVQ